MLGHDDNMTLGFSLRTMNTGLVTTLLLCCLLGNGQAFQSTFAKTFGNAAGGRTARTTQFLNQLCNESQDENTVARDACYGCFFRATNASPGYPMLAVMSACSDKYLNNTDYGHCRAYLRNATVPVDSKGSPVIVYCTFLECVRQVNKDTLIRSCVAEALRMFSNFLPTDVSLAQLFVNTTACILAKTRCADMNPITGAMRPDIADISNKLQMANLNAIYVNTDYDINIIQLPFGNGLGDECGKYRNKQQATWPTVRCTYDTGF